METAIRFSQNSPEGSNDQRFLLVDVVGKAFRLCQLTSTKRGTTQYEVLHASAKVPTFRAFDWHPTNESLIAVGQAGGEATLLNIAQGYQDAISFSIRSQRLCNAVALSHDNLIAVGLDKVRTDFCLNIWDFTQRLPTGGSKSFSKAYSDPLHKLAGGEPISSLKFFGQEPKLLVAGVKGQFVRLYDLRESGPSSALQFPTRCVHNLAIDSLDENYFASCYPASDALVCIWDRRMASRNNVATTSFTAVSTSHNRQPEVSLELRNPVERPGTIWSLRFSKSKRSCLGVLSNMGHLKVCQFGKDYVPRVTKTQPDSHSDISWYEQDPQEIFLDNVQDVERSYTSDSVAKSEKERVVSFDFTTSSTKFGEPKLVVLTGGGEIRSILPRPPPEPVGVSPTGFFCKGSIFVAAPALGSSSGEIPKSVDVIRRKAEARNALKQAFKQSKQNKSSSNSSQPDLRRMSSFANQCWNADLGFFEREVPLADLLRLISASRLRCTAGYLLNIAKNRPLITDSQWVESYWNWIDRAERISRNGGMTQDNVDLSYVGVYSIWMQEIPVKSRLVGSSSASISSIIKNLANRLNIATRRLCTTEYRSHRQLCLHILGLAWSREDIENMSKKLVSGNQHTKAAALAMFASEEKIAYQALRSKNAAQSHKMLAMALAGSKQRRRAATSAADDTDTDTEGEDDWSETISSLSADLTDPYARAILAYVKSGDWVDVLDIEALPLKHRIGVAIRHLEDSDLTEYIGRITRLVIGNGDIEGVVLTGTGTTEGLGLLSSYTRIFNDLQTTILGMSVGGAVERFIVSSNDRDMKAKRTVEAFRETYRSQIMRWGLKFDRVRFDIALSNALAQHPSHKLSRPKEQIRLVCTFCSGSLTQFPSNGSPGSEAPAGGVGTARTIETAKNPLTSERAAVTGTVCPKCGRHLPRCGVCELWLGSPDETFAKWYVTQQQKQNDSSGTGGGGGERGKMGSTDLAASMTGSVMTTIGPPTSTSTTVKASSTASGDADGEFDKQLAMERQWEEAMHKFTIFCVACAHGFHATHAKMWFEGRNGREGHRVCPVPGCDCKCNG